MAQYNTSCLGVGDLLLASLALASSVNAIPKPFTKRDTGLWTALKAQGRQFMGTALTVRDDAAETAIISNANDFNLITPENAQKWDQIEPSQGQFTFDAADQHVEYATSRDYHVHCHTLVWHSQLPAWVSEGGFDNATLTEVMRNHINEVAGRYEGRCAQWDVVNEALNEDGTYRSSVFYNTIGEAFIPLAFAMAKAADPSAALFYNDYNLEYGTAKYEGALRIVKLIQQHGVEIDGVGLQAHLTSEGTESSGGGVTPSESALAGVLKGFTELDVDVLYTEIDVRFTLPSTETKLQEQKDAFQRIAASCIAVERCVGMIIWGASDKYSWIPGVFPGEGDALLWDENYQKKPAYDGFLAGIQG